MNQYRWDIHISLVPQKHEEALGCHVIFVNLTSDQQKIIFFIKIKKKKILDLDFKLNNNREKRIGLRTPLTNIKGGKY